MIGILIMLNNYMHDFATAIFVVATYGMTLLVRYAEVKGGRDLREMAVAFYPRMVHLAGGSAIFLFIAGIVRTFTYKEYEWNSAVEHGQVEALMIKHVLLFVLFAIGIYLWIGVHRKISAMRKEVL
ncbi:MAG: hypothetical protein WA162_05970 [Thermodesulfobacteriota bacterium]